MRLINNDPDGIMFHTARAAHRLPELQTGIPSPVAEQSGSRRSHPLQGLFAEREAALAILNAAASRLESVHDEQMATWEQDHLRGLCSERAFPDGGIYYYAPLSR
jgi:hypothetical protein